MFVESWSALLRTVVVGSLAYAALVLLLRFSGKRILSKWNAFEWRRAAGVFREVRQEPTLTFTEVS